MQVVYPVGSSMVYLIIDRRFYLVFGSTLFTDCSLFYVLVGPGNVHGTGSGFRVHKNRIIADHRPRLSRARVDGRASRTRGGSSPGDTLSAAAHFPNIHQRSLTVAAAAV
jgi:hypothetical protein